MLYQQRKLRPLHLLARSRLPVPPSRLPSPLRPQEIPLPRLLRHLSLLPPNQLLPRTQSLRHLPLKVHSPVRMDLRLPTSLPPAHLSNQWHQQPVPLPLPPLHPNPSHPLRPPNQLNLPKKQSQLQQRRVQAQVKVHQVSQDSSISSFPSSISISIFNLFLQISQISSFPSYPLHS